jgi:sigma-B regulation protein RsbU (phosphoserine phosphatase)
MLLKAEYEGVKRSADPATLLRQLNSRIVGTYRSNALTMTAMCFDLDLSTGEVVYASAAHPCAVVVRKGGAQELPTGGTLLGLVPELDVKEGRSRVEPGEGIYAYTDGISEATSPTNELFGEERLIAALVEGHSSATAVRVLEKAAVTFTKAGGFSDDATIIGILREGEPPKA